MSDARAVRTLAAAEDPFQGFSENAIKRQDSITSLTNLTFVYRKRNLSFFSFVCPK
jgi:hypothetical protein